MHVYYKKIYTDKDFYTLDHASNMLIFKKNGDFSVRFPQVRVKA